MKINDLIHGFKITNIRPLAQAGGQAVEMTHEKSGARLLFLDREDSNKTFSIGFRTVPEDDTGVFHILEHSVLCGSDKYRLKEPFVELLKSSMNTFLNAMTFSDKTLYPISSQNDKDFFNLMSVYLDAVFKPLIYTKPEIFAQEGWHFEFSDDAPAIYKGVVFNEMKGVYADADSVLDNEISSKLFPDSGYGFESGGLPSKIPTLTYEKFTQTHSRFYHPSNSYIFLDGSIDIDKALALIDTEYLSHYEKIEPMPRPAVQAPVRTGRTESFYELTEDMPLEKQCILGKAYVIGSFEDRETTLTCKILADVLSGNNMSPIKKAFLEKGLCDDITVQVNDGVMQPWILVTVRNIDENRADEAEKLLDDTIKSVIKNGIDKAMLEASISNFEFILKEKDFGIPLGLYYSIASLETWLYDSDPVKGFEFGNIFDVLRDKISTDWYESILNKIFLESEHSCSVLLKPSHTLGDEERKRESDEIKKRLENMTSDEINELKNKQERLLEWQSSADSPEALASIPKIELDDIERDPERIDTSSDGQIITHKIHTDSITYINMYFDITGIGENELLKASLISGLLGKLDTKNYSALDLQTKTMTKCGNLSFDIRTFSDPKNADDMKIKFCVSLSALDRNVTQALELVKEILTSTKFDDNSAVLDLVRQDKTDLYQSIVSAGSKYAIRRAQSSINSECAVTELTDGFAYYLWIKDFEGNEKDMSVLKSVYNMLFSSDNALISITNDRPNELKDEIKSFISSLGERVHFEKSIIKPFERSNEAVAIPGDIAFAALSGLSERPMNGTMLLISHIVTLEYLWNEVRVKEGAYGTGMKAQTDGCISYYSFRDPASPNSVNTFKKVCEYLDGYLSENPDLTGAIIGTISDISPLMTPRLKASAADSNYLRNVTFDDIKKLRGEIISACSDDIRREKEFIEKTINSSNICVIGSKEQISNCNFVEKTYSL